MAVQPKLLKTIPDQIVNEGASLGPLNLNEFIQSSDADGLVHFQAELSNGAAFPGGIICTGDGILSGIPVSGTRGIYEIVLKVKNDAEEPLVVHFKITIKERIVLRTDEEVQKLKKQVWEAVMKDLAIPELGDLLKRPLTAIELEYLLQRYAVFVIWDVYNLDRPGKMHLLHLEGASQQYDIYDRGSCLVGAPKELFSYKRTQEDALQTARVMIREVYKRGWVVEFSEYKKNKMLQRMAQAAWIEAQIQSDLQGGKALEILHYIPTERDLKLYAAQVSTLAPKIS